MSLAQTIAQTLNALEKDFAILNSNTARSNVETEHELYQLKLRLFALQPDIDALAGKAWNPWRHIAVQLEILEQDIFRQQKNNKDNKNKDYPSTEYAGLNDVRYRLAHQQLSLYINEIVKLVEKDDQSNKAFYRLNETLHFGEALLIYFIDAGAKKDIEKDPLFAQEVASLEQTLADLQARLETRSQAISRTVLKHWVETAKIKMADIATEVLIDAEKLTHSAATYSFSRMEKRLQWFKRVAEPITTDFGFHKLSKQLHNEWVEKTISLRIENRWGEKAESYLDALILSLIIVVVGLLGFDVIFDPDEKTRHILLIIDTIVCFGFLFEFSLKMTLSPDRRNYFYRHWFTDLLPSIPFGLIQLWIEMMQVVSQHATVIRALRMPSLVLKKLRPMIKIFRVIIFSIRAMDRLVRRQSKVLKRQIVFFEPKIAKNNTVALIEKAEQLRNKFRSRRLEVMQLLSTDEQASINTRDQQHYADEIKTYQQLPLYQGYDNEGSARNIRVENLIDYLNNIQDSDIGANLGPDFSGQARRLLRICRIPPLRFMPFFNDVVRAGKKSEAHNLAVNIAHQIGIRLQKINDRILFFADLHGVITTPQLVDRVGKALVLSLKRPAIRLLLFGAIFVVITGLIGIIESVWLENVAKWLRGNLGIPILVLGVIAGVGMGIGLWLQKIASSTADFYAKVAEAHFLGLLKDAKKNRAGHDHKLLVERVLNPELLVQGLAEIDFDTLRKENQALGALHDFRLLIRSTIIYDQEAAQGSLSERIYLLYRQYLSGSPLHRSDTKSTSQLLGNLCLQDIIKRVLKIDKKTIKEIKALDLSNHEALTGPSMWFNFITQAIAQRTGQLVEDYNRHIIPTVEMASRSTDEVNRYQWWLNHKISDSEDYVKPNDEFSEHYSSTVFSSLDFLTNEPGRLAFVEKNFGSEVSALLVKDRKLMIREIFGSYPYHLRPLSKRSVNCYEFYQKYLERGRVLLLPWYFMRQIGRILHKFYQWLRIAIAELLDPKLRQKSSLRIDSAGFDIALRKIHRMRKPVFLVMMKLRALLDVEYLGLVLPGTKSQLVINHNVITDLDLIEANELERKYFYQIIAQQRKYLGNYNGVLKKINFTEDRIKALIGDDSQSHYEIIRALVNAYTTNYHNLRDLLHYDDDVQRVINQAIANKGRLTGKNKTMRRLFHHLTWWSKWLLMPSERKKQRSFKYWWRAVGDHYSDVQNSKIQAYVLSWWRADISNFQYLAELGGVILPQTTPLHTAPLKMAEQIITHVVSNPSSWTEQLVTMRTLQTLTLLDVETDKFFVKNLGEYDPEHIEVIHVPTL